MTLFIAILAFGFAFYLFVITNNKIKSIKENIFLEDIRKEIEGFIAEFNKAATRNIELLEDKISELQELIKKADAKILKLDEIYKSSSKPIVIEKIIERDVTPQPNKKEKIKQEEKPEKEILEKEKIISTEKLDRREKLKKLISEGKTKEELLSLGYMENEINLVSFMVKMKKEGE